MSAPVASTPAERETVSPPSPATHPLLGVVAVLLGALIATGTGRLLSVGLADLRGALHYGVDEASWLGSVFNAALMFIGPFSVYLGGLLGPRRVLLACACGFTLFSFLLPFAASLPGMLALLALAGLTAGTFYPLTLSFVLRNLPMRYILLGIAMYAMDIVFVSNVATSLEASLIEHLSWRWIFWTGTLVTPVMVALIHFGIPRQPLPKPKEGQPSPNWRGFLYGSLGFATLYLALDQGQRLDWLHSGTIVGLAAVGGFLLLMTIARRMRMPNPLINFRFLLRRNTLLLGCILVIFRFTLLSTLVVIPSYLSSVAHYLPLQTGPVLLWVALPQAVTGLLAMYLLRYVDARMILATGFTLVAVACLIDSHLSSAWSGQNFGMSQAILAFGLAFSFNGLVGSIVLEVIDTGALSRPIDILTFAGFFQAVRLFGGEAGAAFMQHFISIREQFHSNVVGLSVAYGQSPTDRRLFALSAGLSSKSNGLLATQQRVAEILGLQVRQQAFTLAIHDAFLLLAAAVVLCLVLIACMTRVPTRYLAIIRSAPRAA